MSPLAAAVKDDEEEEAGPEFVSNIYYVIQRFLASGPCQQSAERLKREIEQCKLLPARYDITGAAHPRTFAQYEKTLNSVVPADFLERLCLRLSTILEEKLPTELQETKKSLVDVFIRSQSHRNGKHRLSSSEIVATVNHENRYFSPCQRDRINFVNAIYASQHSTSSRLRKLACKSFASRFECQTRILGHLSSVFCVNFDQTGQYVFTGADDNLIKIWSVREGRLLFTFLGFDGEVTDIAVSFDNTLLAGSSCDRSIRVWSLQNCAPVVVLSGHNSMVTSIRFLPLIEGNKRFLVSTSKDCCVCFWMWNVLSSEFDPTPVKFSERLRIGGQMICCSHSASGRFVAAGGTDYYIRIYYINNGCPERILEVEGHNDRVDSLQWAHRGLRFVSASRDGTAKVWTYKRQEWQSITLAVHTARKGTEKCSEVKIADSEIAAASKAAKFKVTMVTWNCDDSLICTASSDHLVRVWDPVQGNLLRTCKGHTDEAFVLEPHPLYPDLILSAGYDGYLYIWNVQAGVLVKKHFNSYEGYGHGAFFDCRFSPDGNCVATVDSHGHLLLFGIDSNDLIKKAPGEQFFHNDYRPLLRDANNYVIDEQTQTAPHLMPPPFLVNSDGGPYPPALQRFVPGREHCSENFLVPRTLQIGDLFYLPGDDQVRGSQSTPLVCCWTQKPLIRPFSHSHSRFMEEENAAFAADEVQYYECESKKEPLPTASAGLMRGR